MRKRLDPTLVERVLDLYQAGLSYQAIADTAGVSIARVGYVVQTAHRRGIVGRRVEYLRPDRDPPRAPEAVENYAWLDPLLRALWAVEAEARRLERCPACLRKGSLQVVDGSILGWAAACTCGFKWYRRQGPPRLPLAPWNGHRNVWTERRCLRFWLTGR